MINQILNILYIGIALLGSLSLFVYKGRKSHLFLIALTVPAAIMIWGKFLSVGPVPNLAPIIVVMFFIPGFIVLELTFPALAIKLNYLERVPLLFGLSLAFWTIFSAVAYRIQPPSDLTIGSALAAFIAGLTVIFVKKSPYKDPKSFLERLNQKKNIIKYSYVFSLIIVLLIVAIVVGFSAEYQRYDFDSSFHLAGYNKIADNPSIIGGNAFLGPEYSYLSHYITHPWYLVFGLSARLAHSSVTWLYVCLAVILTPLFFLSFFSLLKVLLQNKWAAIVGTLMVIGPWISKMALSWGPPMGTFYLQFLPYPGTYTQLILFPIWLASCFRYIQFQTPANLAMSVLLAVATMGQHPEFLLVVPYCTAIIFIVSMFFPAEHLDRIKLFTLLFLVFSTAGVLAFLTSYPPGYESWKGVGYANNEALFFKDLMKQALVINSNLYSVHPKHLLTLANLKSFMGCFIFAFFIGFQPRLVIKKNGKGRLPNFSVLLAHNPSQRKIAAAMVMVFVGPLLIIYNPVLVPIIIKVLGSTIPIRYIALEFEVFVLACEYGAIVSIVIFLLESDISDTFKNNIKLVLLLLILIVGIGVPLGRSKVRNTILGMINREEAVSILDIGSRPLFEGLAELEPGIVAIQKELAEYLVMSTSHYVVSSTRMIKERQLDNEKILNFSVGKNEMKRLLRKYDCRYVAVPIDDNLISNGDFSKSALSWGPEFSCTIKSVPGGQNGNCLQLTRTGYGSQIIFQNITVDLGKLYEIKGSVKSGTSGDEPFAIQIFRHNSSGTGEYSIEGKTTDSWVEHSMRFRANYKELSIVLRKNSASPGTMLFDSISLREVAARHNVATGDKRAGIGDPGGKEGGTSKTIRPYSPLQRFREQPEIFKEVFTFDDYAVFEVRKKGKI